MKSGLKTTLIIAGALAAGLGTGLLFAPRKGIKSRKKLKKKVKKICGQLAFMLPTQGYLQEEVE